MTAPTPPVRAVVHPKVKVPAVVLTILTAVLAIVTGVGANVPGDWAPTIAAGIATVLQFVIGYLTPSG